MTEKKEETFVVRDRRKFTTEGDLRPDAPPDPEERVAVASPPAESDAAKKSEQAAPDAASGADAAAEGQEELPAPPTAEEESAQRNDYSAANKDIDQLLKERGAPASASAEINMERLISSMYMTSMMQMGMLREEGVPVRVDLIGARQSVDTLALLQEKTKGNLTEREAHLLQNVLFELRMAFIELTKAVTAAPKPGTPGPEKK